MPQQAGRLIGYHRQLRVEIYEPGRTPGDGPPDSVVELSGWIDGATGQEISDPDQIAELEAGAARFRRMVATQEQEEGQ